MFGPIAWQNQNAGMLPPGDGGDDAHFVSVLHGRGALFEEADVFVVHENIHEATDVALLIADAFAQAGESLVEIVEQFSDVRAGGGDDFEIVGKFAEWGGDADGGHRDL